MGAADAEERRGRRRWPRILAALALVAGLVLLGLWLARKPIARGEADRFLVRAGVPARYAIASLGLGRQRFTGVVIGDPAHPDLVADWLETRTDWGLSGPYLASIRGGHVRVRARIAGGRLSLGSLDRLLPRGEAGKPFALPALAVEAADLRVRADTPWGVVGAKLSGKGRLDGGFDGRLAITAARLGGDCGAVRPEGVWRVRTQGAGLATPARVLLDGSAQAAGFACTGAAAGYANVNGTATLSLGKAFGWAATQDVAVTAPRHPAARARLLTGRVTLTGDAGSARGDMALDARDVRHTHGTAAAVALRGAVVLDGGGVRLGEGRPASIALTDARLDPALLRRAVSMQVAAGTPVAPLLMQFARAARRAGERFDATASGGLVANRDSGSLSLRGLDVTATTGARAIWSGEAATAWGRDADTSLDGRFSVAGGGLPSVAASVRRNAQGLLSGTAVVQPYAAGDARLALTPVAFRRSRDGWRVTTTPTLSGPLGDGRVDGLSLPLDARWRDGALTLAGACAPLRWQSLAVSGLRLDPAALRLCPTGAALLAVRGGRVGGGARIAATRLTGRLGASPLTVATADAQVRLGDRSFALTDVVATLGAPERVTRLSVGALEGRLGGDGIAGRFARAGGQVGAVPLVLQDAAGTWRFARGALDLGGALTVTDAASTSRFQPMAARAVTLRLAGNRVAAAGTLHEPTTGTKVADVTLRHDLAVGRGDADLTVANLAFIKGFQPDLLTKLTYGVIANVRGTVSGEGHIAWTPAGVTSTGAFRTAGTDLAAAFGPVTGLTGEIRFTDLLALESAPHQRVTVKSINPGVPVTDGIVTFQTLPNTRIAVEGARWPFAGGELVLEPTLLDFAAAAERRMTFRVTGAAADKFLQSFDFKNLNATGTFDGVLPMVFDTAGGHIVDGRLTVRPGGGTIAYVGDLSRKQLGFWGDFAFGALRSLRYRSLGITMNGPLAGEMVTEVRFAGVSQGAGAKTNFLIRRLQRLPIVFNIRIRAPFRGLLDATASFYDPRRLIERNLPELIKRQNAIQPPASEKVP